MKELDIIINQDGTVEVDLKGFNGKGCSELTDELIRALNGDVVKRSQKHEYYKPVPKIKLKQHTKL